MRVEWSPEHRSGAARSPRWLGAEVWQLATRQHGVVGKGQLLARGTSRRVVDRWVREHHIRPLHRNVYAVGHGRLTVRGWWMAAVLAGGEGAVLSHRCSASLRDLIGWQPRRPAISVPAHRRIEIPGVAVHRIQVLAPDVVDGIPCSSVVRTILDMAAISRWRQLENIVERANQLRLYDHRAMEHLLAAVSRPRGVRRLRAVLAAFDPAVSTTTRSGLEEAMLALCDRAGLPRPLVNSDLQLLDGTWTEADFHWPAARVVVETDGERFHASRPRRRKDRAKDRALQLAGWLVLRVPEDELEERPEAVLADLRLALRRSSGA